MENFAGQPPFPARFGQKNEESQYSFQSLRDCFSSARTRLVVACGCGWGRLCAPPFFFFTTHGPSFSPLAFLLATYLLHCQDLYTAANCSFNSPQSSHRSQPKRREARSLKKKGWPSERLADAILQVCLSRSLLTHPPHAFPLPCNILTATLLGPFRSLLCDWSRGPRLATVPHQSRKQAAHHSPVLHLASTRCLSDLTTTMLASTPSKNKT